MQIQGSQVGPETLHFYMLPGNTDATCVMDYTLRSKTVAFPRFWIFLIASLEVSFKLSQPVFSIFSKVDTFRSRGLIGSVGLYISYCISLVGLSLPESIIQNKWRMILSFYFFKERGEGKEKEREGEKHQCVVAPCTPWPATQACALTKN